MQARRGKLVQAEEEGGESSSAAVHRLRPLLRSTPTPVATIMMTCQVVLIGQILSPCGSSRHWSQDRVTVAVRKYLAEPYGSQAISPWSYWAMKEADWLDLFAMKK